MESYAPFEPREDKMRDKNTISSRGGVKVIKPEITISFNSYFISNIILALRARVPGIPPNGPLRLCQQDF